MFSNFGALLEPNVDSMSHCIPEKLLRNKDLATPRQSRYGRKCRRPSMDSVTEQYVYCRNCDCEASEARRSIVLLPRKYRYVTAFKTWL